jgi:hypothetical protein
LNIASDKHMKLDYSGDIYIYILGVLHQLLRLVTRSIILNHNRSLTDRLSKLPNTALHFIFEY